MEFKTSDELREFILNRQDFEEEFHQVKSSLNGLTWKKDKWVIRIDDKKVLEIAMSDVPSGTDIRSIGFVDSILKALRLEGLAGVQKFLGGLK